MRHLIVIHGYPPDGTAGAENYAARVAGMLAARGDDVRVLTAVKDISRADTSLHDRVHEGVRVTEVVNNLFIEEFRETYDDPRLARRFAEVVDDFRPDVVQVQQLMYHSIGVLDVCRERGIPVVYVVHDFWLGCARFGQLLHADGARCEHVDPARCGTCLPSLPWRQSDAARRVGRAVAGIKGATGLDLSGPLTRAHRSRTKPSAPGEDTFEPPPAEVARRYASDARDRIARIVSAANGAVDRFIVGARFLVPWFERLGLDAERFRVVSTGLDWDRPAEERVRRPDPEGRTRFLFLGTLVPHKGAHVLLDAWGRLGAADRARATLTLHGPDRYRPAYADELRATADGLDHAVVLGALDREGVADALTRADVLVVPSLWVEVRPLVICEAHAAGLRVVVSDLGGMAELLEDGVPGRGFPTGDADALARALAAEIARPAEEPSSPGPSPLFPTWEGMLDRVLEVTDEAMERRRRLLG